jgi:hypothetical protein
VEVGVGAAVGVSVPAGASICAVIITVGVAVGLRAGWHAVIKTPKIINQKTTDLIGSRTS